MRMQAWCFVMAGILLTACGLEATPIGDSSSPTTLRFVNYSPPELPLHPSSDLRSVARFSLLGTGKASIRSFEIATTSTKTMRTTGDFELWFKGKPWALANFTSNRARFYPTFFGPPLFISDDTSPVFDLRGQILDSTFEEFDLSITRIEAVDELSAVGKPVIGLLQENYTELLFPIPLTRLAMQSGTLASSLPDISPAGQIYSYDLVQNLLAVFRLSLYGEDATLAEFSLQFTLGDSLQPEAVTNIQVDDYHGKNLARAPTVDQLGREMILQSNYPLPDHLSTDIYVSAKIKKGATGSVRIKLAHIQAVGHISKAQLSALAVDSNHVILRPR